jgi:cation:H+ antiporter
MISVVPGNRYLLNRTGWVQVGSASLLVGIAVVMWFSSGGAPVIERWVGFMLLFFLGVYLCLSYFWAKQGGASGSDGQAREERLTSIGKCIFMIVGGLVLVIFSARILVPAASEIALRIGVPEDVVAATMVAFGTSLPELMTAIAAVMKGHPEIALGNVIGADVLNCLFVIGASAAARPLAVPRNFYVFHFPAMLLILYSFRIFVFFNRNENFKRWQGAWLLLIYCIYVTLQYSLDLGVEGG